VDIPKDPQELRSLLATLNVEELALINWKLSWQKRARPKQLPPEDNSWSIYGIKSGRGFGKRLCIKTPVPTPMGWVALGDLRVGDEVFDENGKPSKISAIYDSLPEIAWRLRFSDHTHIDACAEHLWVTWTHADRKALRRKTFPTEFPENWPAWRSRYLRHGPQVRTTQEIVKTLVYGKRGDTNHCIPLARPLQTARAQLRIDPYVLGYWLGNGGTATSRIYGHREDFDFVRAEFERAGVRFSKDSDEGKDVLRFSVTAYGLITALRALGVAAYKHVPSDYLWADIEQRAGILAGLLDSDGYISPKDGYIEFCSMAKNLADAVMHLARSLGQKPVLSEGRAKLNGTDHGTKYRVTWRPTVNPFRSPRKSAAFKTLGSQGIRNQHRMITGAERIDPVPMRCLTVDSQNHLFLVGAGMIPTHNTLAAANWLGLQAAQDPGSYNFVVAPTYEDVRYTAFEGPTGLFSAIPPELILESNLTVPSITLKNKALIRGFAADSYERLRGPQCGRAWCDEIASWRYPDDAWDMLNFGLRLGTHPQIIWTGTPKPSPFVRKLLKMPNSIVVSGSTYENRANLAPKFFEALAKYEGTKIGRQELYGEVLDPEEEGIIKRSHFRLWPAKTPLPKFQTIIMSLDTAFTEKTFDKRKQSSDPTACTVWGVFEHELMKNVLLLDAWEAHLSFPDLVTRVKKEREFTYGDADEPILKPRFSVPFLRPSHQGRKIDIILIEDKGSGISLRQSLARENILTTPYNPGRMDKLMRLHAVSPVFVHGRVWVVESDKNEGQPRSWAEPLIGQMCSFIGEGSIAHDDLLDTGTQALKLVLDKFGMVFTVPRNTDLEARDQAERIKRRSLTNPYQQ